MPVSQGSVLCWLRRDLRLDDHPVLAHITRQGWTVYPVFIFDEHILGKLKKDDRRVPWLYQQILILKEKFRSVGSDLWLLYGRPEEEIPQFMRKKNIQHVWAHRDYEPYARQRDKLLSSLVSFHTLADHVLVEPTHLKPYRVFTPYFKVWQECFEMPTQTKPLYHQLAAPDQDSLKRIKSLTSLGFTGQAYTYPTQNALWRRFVSRIDDYALLRNKPAEQGTSGLSPYLHFGIISVRKPAVLALRRNSSGAQKFISELAWRDFYQQVLWHWPNVAHESFQEAYRHLPYPSREDWFLAWCVGKTGYPLVDAGMRQLNQYGYMHNRLRMVCASFLVKDLLVIGAGEKLILLRNCLILN